MRNIICLVFFFVAAFINAEILGFPFFPGEIDINITKSNNLYQLDRINDAEYDYIAFKNHADTYEIRVLQFGILEAGFSNEELEGMFYLYTYMVMLNLVGDESAVTNITQFTTEQVRNYNNADAGFLVAVRYQNPKTPMFFNGYEYVLMNFFINFDTGIVIKARMFNSLDVYDEEHFSTDFLIFNYR